MEAPNVHFIPTNKVGTPFQSPSWRAEALFHPDRFGLLPLCSSFYESGKAKRRNLLPVLEPMPEDLANILDTLPTQHKNLYLSLIDRKFVETQTKKHTIWHIANVEKYVNDIYFLQAVEHITEYKVNADIAFAITLGTDERQGVIAKMLAYSIFLGKSDVDLYKEWNIRPRQLKWFRLLFADFSHFPQTDVARWSILRQLANNGTITEVDFNYFRRLSDLGEVAMKAQCSFHKLTDQERGDIEHYLGNTAIVNVMDQHASIRTLDDSRQYTKSVMEFAKLSAQKQHMRNVELTIRMNSAKLEQISAADNGIVSPEEQKLLDELYRRSLIDSKPLEVKTIADLK